MIGACGQLLFESIGFLSFSFHDGRIPCRMSAGNVTGFTCGTELLFD